jgi:hypothetical protein
VLLQDHAEPCPQRLQIARVDVCSVDGDAPAVRLQHAQQTHYGRRLSASRAAHDSDLFSRLNFESDFFEDVLQFRAIPYTKIFEIDLSTRYPSGIDFFLKIKIVFFFRN